MVRAQILLDERHYHFLKKLSRKTGESISSLVRKGVEKLMEPEPSNKDKALALLGAFEADRNDVSVRHDEYFAEAGEE